jgi:hypothetical protein
MKKFVGLLLGLFGIFALTTPLASELNPHSNDRALSSPLGAGRGGAAPVYLVPATRAQRRRRVDANLPIPILQSSLAPSLDRGLSEAPQEPMPLWLSELNQWRRMAGLRLVAENARLSDGSEEHARYLVAQGPEDTALFRAYDRSLGPMAHLENSHSSSYTAAGAEAAIGGPLKADIIQGADVAWEGRTESGDIDNLIAAPFHRLSLLAPWAQIAGYGSVGEYPIRAAALALRGPLAAKQHREPIEFPPANTNISINALSGSEWPNPIASCAGYQRPVGLPITLQTGGRLVLQSYSLRDQTSGLKLDACGFDAFSYRNGSAVERKRGRELLNAYAAVVLIPRKPLLPGRQYRIVMQTSQGRLEWAFRVNAAEIEPTQTRRTSIRQVATTR